MIRRRRHSRPVSIPHAEKKIIALAGPPGAGKTRHRTTKLSDLPYLDIADIYAEHPGIEPSQALMLFQMDIEGALYENNTLVLEAMFRPGGQARALLSEIAHKWDAKLEIRDFSAPKEILRDRIQAQYQERSSEDPERWRRYTEARLRLVDYFYNN
jgi:predicted kinase